MAPLDASSGQGEARIVDSHALRRGVRMELIVAPASFLLPAVVAWAFLDLGLRTHDGAYAALAVILFGGNVVFDYLMVRAALRFFLKTRPPRVTDATKP